MLNDDHIASHFLWDEEIVCRDREREFPTGRFFSEFRQSGHRLRIFQVTGNKIEYEDTGSLRIFRVIPGEIEYENIGRHWSWAEPWKDAWNPGEPEFMHKIDRSKPVFLLTARIVMDDVDWPETTIQNLDWGFREREIVPKVGTLQMLGVHRLVDDDDDERMRVAKSISKFPPEAIVAY